MRGCTACSFSLQEKHFSVASSSSLLAALSANPADGSSLAIKRASRSYLDRARSGRPAPLLILKLAPCRPQFAAAARSGVLFSGVRWLLPRFCSLGGSYAHRIRFVTFDSPADAVSGLRSNFSHRRRYFLPAPYETACFIAFSRQLTRSMLATKTSGTVDTALVGVIRRHAGGFTVECLSRCGPTELTPRIASSVGDLCHFHVAERTHALFSDDSEVIRAKSGAGDPPVRRNSIRR